MSQDTIGYSIAEANGWPSGTGGTRKQTRTPGQHAVDTPLELDTCDTPLIMSTGYLVIGCWWCRELGWTAGTFWRDLLHLRVLNALLRSWGFS